MNRSRNPLVRHLAALGLACIPEMISIVETDPSTEAFTFVHYADGSVVISHEGNAATLLRGDRATTFLAEVALDGLQAVAARWTSKYRPGVVFVARAYPRKPVRRPPLT